jgi:hypothetical protein
MNSSGEKPAQSLRKIWHCGICVVPATCEAEAEGSLEHTNSGQPELDRGLISKKQEKQHKKHPQT